MLQFLLHDLNLVFSITLGLVVLFGTIELVGMLVGLSPLGMFDDVIDIDALSESSTHVLGFLGLGKMPFQIWLLAFLFVFSVVGLSINLLVVKSILPSMTYLAVGASLCISVLIVNRVGHLWASLVPSESTTAVSHHSFEGRLATITVGKSTAQTPAEAKVIDTYGQTHYVMVAPLDKDESYPKGSQVLLVKKLDKHWLVVSHHPSI